MKDLAFRVGFPFESWSRVSFHNAHVPQVIRSVTAPNNEKLGACKVAGMAGPWVRTVLFLIELCTLNLLPSVLDRVVNVNVSECMTRRVRCGVFRHAYTYFADVASSYFVLSSKHSVCTDSSAESRQNNHDPCVSARQWYIYDMYAHRSFSRGHWRWRARGA